MMARIVLFFLVGFGLACGQVEPLDANRPSSGFDAGAATPLDAGSNGSDSGVKTDSGPVDAGQALPDDHANQRLGGSRLVPGQGITGNLDGDGDVDWFVFEAAAADLHRIETRGETDTNCVLYLSLIHI